MQTHWVQGDDPGGRPGRPAGEPGRRELSAGAPGRAVPLWGEREVVATSWTVWVTKMTKMTKIEK